MKIMIQGTMSDAGKSVVCAALLRALARRGLRAAPFKAQNMANNSAVTEDGAEIGRAQMMQAEAAGVRADARMNPVLLKPTGESASQVIVCGRAKGTLSAREYYARKAELLPAVLDSFFSLEREFDAVVIEGAGSPVELNLAAGDFVNEGLAERLNAPVLLVGDIDRGGIFAQMHGTLSLLRDRTRVYGLLVNKFRGDLSLFKEGRRMLEEVCGVPVLGVLPAFSLDLDDEDSLSPRLARRERGEGTDVAVVRLPHISNFTDFSPLERIFSLRYVSSAREFGAPKLVLLPGTKNTAADLAFLRASGLAEQVLAAAHRGVPVFGVCGGFQMLGGRILDPAGAEGGDAQGLGLLPFDTVFSPEKTVRRVRGRAEGLEGFFSCLNGAAYEGYEIHMGAGALFCGKGFAGGSYVHGLFDGEAASRLAAALGGREVRFDREAEYDRLADWLEENADVDAIVRILRGEERG